MAPPGEKESLGEDADDYVPSGPFPEFQVVVLAGGIGSRLSSLMDASASANCCGCKAFLPVANRPMIWYCLKNLLSATFGDILVVTQERHQAELSAYLQAEFGSAFRRLEVVGLAGQVAGAEKKKCLDTSVECDGSEDEIDPLGDTCADDDGDVCGTAEALHEIRNKIYTDFFVVSCDLVGQVDFFALANRHRTENAAVTIYLLSRDFLASETGEGVSTLSKKKSGGVSIQENEIINRGNQLVAVTDEEDKQILALHDRQSMHHGDSLTIPKLHMFLHSSSRLKGDFEDVHVYCFSKSVLNVFDNPRLRRNLYSIRFDLIPFLTAMQYTAEAKSWSGSRLDCDVFERLLSDLQGDDAVASDALDYTNESKKQMHDLANKTGVYTAACPPPKPVSGNKVALCTHTEAAGICCRVNNLLDYQAANLLFCRRMEELRNMMPEWMLPSPSSRKPNTFRDCLIGEDVEIENGSTIKRSIVGKKSRVCSGVKITQSVLMDEATVQQNSVLQHCIVGKYAKVGDRCKLINCQIRSGYEVPPDTNAEDDTLPRFFDVDR